MFAPGIYAPREADFRKGLVLQRFARVTSSSAAAAALSASLFDAIAAEYALQLSHLSARAAGGGAQTVDTLSVDIIDQGSAIVARLFERDNLAIAFASVELSFAAPVLLMPDERLQISATFSAGAVANAIALDVVGIVFPRANIQYSSLS